MVRIRVMVRAKMSGKVRLILANPSNALGYRFPHGSIGQGARILAELVGGAAKTSMKKWRPKPSLVKNEGESEGENEGENEGGDGE